MTKSSKKEPSAPEITATVGRISAGANLVERADQVHIGAVHVGSTDAKSVRDRLHPGTVSRRGRQNPASLLNAKHEVVPFFESIRATNLPS